MAQTPERPARRRALLASLSAAGAALAAGHGAAADIILTDVNLNIGYAPGDQPAVDVQFPGAANFEFVRSATGVPQSRSHSVLATVVNGYVRFRLGSFGTLLRIAAGKKWGTAGKFSGSGGLVSTVQKSSKGATHTLHGGKFTDAYFAFKFQDTTNGNQVDYGWIKGSLTDATYANLTYHFTSFAYDNTGAEIAMGQTAPVSSSVPEPSPLALGALTALVAGAAGVRRWKALRAATTASAAAVEPGAADDGS